MARPDAVSFSAAIRSGKTQHARRLSVVLIAESLLAIDKDAGELAWCHHQHDETIFATRNPKDTVCHPIDHPLSGEPRYRWVTVKDPVAIDGHQQVVDRLRYGFLIDSPDESTPAPEPETIDEGNAP